MSIWLEHFKWALYSFFADNYLYLTLTLVAVAVLFLYRKKAPQSYFLLVLFSLPVLLVIFNPYIVTYLERFPKFTEAVSSRLWIIVPVWIAVAFFLSICMSLIKNPRIRYPIAIVVAALLIVAGTSAQAMGYYIRAEGRYKIRADAVEIADTILSLSEDAPASVLMVVPEEDVQGKYVLAGTFLEGINQYTSNIIIHKCKYSQEMWDDYFMSDIIPGDSERASEVYIGTLLYKYYCENVYDYVIWPADDVILEKMGYCGYELAGQTAGFYIYRYRPRLEASQIASELLRLSEEQSVSVMVMDYVQEDTFNSMNGGSLNSSIRYYSTNITTRSAGISEQRWEIFTDESDPVEGSESFRYMRELFDRYAEAFDYEYVVMPEDEQAIRNMEYLGFEYVSSTAGYSIFVNPYERSE